MIRAWVQASRPLAQANIAVPLIFGQAVAFRVTGSFSFRWALLIHLFGLLDQLWIVWANDVADSDADRLNLSPTPFSGGSRVIPEGKLARSSLSWAAALAGGLLVVLTLGLATQQRPLAPLFAAFAIGLLWAYSFGPLRLSYRGQGEWLQALGVGVVLPVFAYYVQAGTVGGFPLWVLVPTILLGYAGNVLTAIPDVPADRRVSKRTLAVRRGGPVARAVVVALVAIAGIVAAFDPSLSSSGWIVLVAVVGAGGAANAILFRCRPVSEEKEGTGGWRRAMLGFVVANGGWIQGTLLAWSAALWWFAAD